MMREWRPRPPKSAGIRAKSLVAEWAPYVASAVCIWLGWQTVQGMIAVRAPAQLALKIAPTSPVALSRAAEAEFAAGRQKNARALAEAALGVAPFDVRAMRVAGLAIDRAGDSATADQFLTLAGNWSLRDGPTHAWLTSQRLRQGDYQSSFAHADTLARRSEDARPQVFKLFTTAALEDPRSLPILSSFVAKEPNWRWAFMRYLAATPKGDAVAAALATALKDSSAPFSKDETELLYSRWISQSRIGALVWLSSRLGSTTRDREIGGFSVADVPTPFGWRLIPANGAAAEIIDDDLDSSNGALRAEFTRPPSDRLAERMLTLQPGFAVLHGRWRSEISTPDRGFQWRVRCFEDGREIARWRSPDREAPTRWTRFEAALTVPAQGCSAQWLQLTGWDQDGRGLVAAWFDDVALSSK